MKLIAGIDPGTKTAIAILDINSDFYEVFSKKDFSFSSICDYLVSRGDPIIISTDVSKVPELVRKVATAFNARLFYPDHDLATREKKILAEQTDINYRISNNHERDALSAASAARKHFSHVFEKIDKSLKRRNAEHLNEDVKELIIKQEIGNIEQALQLLTAEKPSKKVKFVPKIIESKKLIELRKRLDNEMKSKEFLLKRIQTLENENKELFKQLEAAKRFRKTKIIDNMRKSMNTILREKEYIEKEYSDFRGIDANHEIIVPVSSKESKKNKVVLVDDKINIRNLEKEEPRAIISDNALDTDIPIIGRSNIELKKINKFLVANKADIEKQIQASFSSWLRDYKEKRKNEE